MVELRHCGLKERAKKCVIPTLDMEIVSVERNSNDLGSNDMVSGFLHDKLQKMAIHLRNSCEIKDNSLKAIDDET
ncbi:hypothetical protein Lal_00038869 [Lupinus albus]|nr:hypothetical protein Lal_00038869 [Lupinus albus]